MIINGDSISVAHSGVSKCILVKGKQALAWSIQDSQIQGVLLDNKIAQNPLMPIISTYSLKDLEGGYLVLASGKLFEVTSPDEVKNSVELMDAEDISPDEMSRRLVYGAVNKGLNDFLNVAIVKL